MKEMPRGELWGTGKNNKIIFTVTLSKLLRILQWCKETSSFSVWYKPRLLIGNHIYEENCPVPLTYLALFGCSLHTMNCGWGNNTVFY